MNAFVRLALDEGIVIGWHQGLEQGREQERARHFSMLQRIFERRLQRPLTAKEVQRIHKRIDKDGPESIGDIVGSLSPEQLSAWLAPRKRKA